MASTDQVKMKAQPAMYWKLPSTPAGRPKPSRLLHEKSPGEKIGRMINSTSGMIVQIPRMVAKRAPRRIPSQLGTNMISMKTSAVMNVEIPIDAPNFSCSGPNDPPYSIPKRSLK